MFEPIPGPMLPGLVMDELPPVSAGIVSLSTPFTNQEDSPVVLTVTPAVLQAVEMKLETAPSWSGHLVLTHGAIVGCDVGQLGALATTW